MIIIKFRILLLAVVFSLAAQAQQTPFNIYIEPLKINGLGGLQSFAYGQHDGKWLIMGGRLDGLHRRQPFASFDVAGNNNQLLVVDPLTKEVWTAPLTPLSVNLQEQLSSTNMEYHQDGDYLYLIGGYGYNTATSSRKTFDKMTAVNVPAVIDAVINSTSFTTYFRQITDNEFAVTGGHLNKINNTYYLIGGNRFDGNYNPMGHASYTQVYTDAIRKFNLSDNGTTINITHLTTITDAANLHRRDYNAVPQILPNGAEGVTAFSGVFQPTVNLPFLNSVTIDSLSYAVDNNFQQYYNHYHCPVLPAYAASDNRMHTVFFGGIAQYYDSAGVLVQDNNVPFVKTIARVSRESDGSMAEFKLPVEMPTLLGASAEFIRVENIPHYDNEVIKLDDLPNDSTMVGYIYGGISSTAKNIFFTNTGTQSSASSQIFKVYLIKGETVGLDEINTHSVGSLNMKVYPNPSEGELSIAFNLIKIAPTRVSIRNILGKEIFSEDLSNLTLGENIYHPETKYLPTQGSFIISIETPFEKAVQKVILKN